MTQALGKDSDYHKVYHGNAWYRVVVLTSSLSHPAMLWFLSYIVPHSIPYIMCKLLFVLYHESTNARPLCMHLGKVAVTHEYHVSWKEPQCYLWGRTRDSESRSLAHECWTPATSRPD